MFYRHLATAFFSLVIVVQARPILPDPASHRGVGNLHVVRDGSRFKLDALDSGSVSDMAQRIEADKYVGMIYDKSTED